MKREKWGMTENKAGIIQRHGRKLMMIDTQREGGRDRENTQNVRLVYLGDCTHKESKRSNKDLK